MAAFRRNGHVLQRLFLSKQQETPLHAFCIKNIHTSFRVCSKLNSLALFMRDDVQTLLHRLTGFNPDRIFRKFKADKASPPEYKVLSDEELQEELAIGKVKAEQRLQMPPFMRCREPRQQVLSEDPDIAPALTSKYVFVDISEKTKRIKVKDHRPIVCRHEDGRLTFGDWDQVDRFSQMFDPVPGRSMFTPKMFEEDNLEKILNEANYLYILERACVQFDPDSEDFIRVTQRVYEHACHTISYDELRSTRFFGPMSFYFCWVDKIEPLLADMISKHMIDDAADLVTLYRIVKQQEKQPDADPLTIVKQFCTSVANQEYFSMLNEALAIYEMASNKQKQVQ